MLILPSALLNKLRLYHTSVGPNPSLHTQAIVEIPFVLVQSIVYGVITYYMIQFDFESGKVAWFLFFTFLLLLCECCLVQCAGRHHDVDGVQHSMVLAYHHPM